MTRTQRVTTLICALLLLPAMRVRAQDVDTVRADSTAERLGLWARASRRSGLTIATGKTYNRVEGLPVFLGPAFHDSAGAAEINASVMGIIRSANTAISGESPAQSMSGPAIFSAAAITARAPAPSRPTPAPTPARS